MPGVIQFNVIHFCLNDPINYKSRKYFLEIFEFE